MKKTVAILTTLALGATATLVLADPGEHPRRAAMMERLKAADTNADGLISRSEAAALPRLAEKFDAIDANKDGQVSFEELRASRGKHRGHGEHFKRMDADKDGKVSKAEALAAAGALFDRVDADRDGFVTQEEAKSARKAYRGAAVK
jgi:Ca2+-binding EF-hand superfamily protein